jgi:hypothetical protein
MLLFNFVIVFKRVEKYIKTHQYYYIMSWLFRCCFKNENKNRKGTTLEEPILDNWDGSSSKPDNIEQAKDFREDSTHSEDETWSQTTSIKWDFNPSIGTTYSTEEYNRSIDNNQINENKKVDKIIRTINKRVNAENSKREYYHKEVFGCHYYLCCCWCCDGTT